MGLDLLRGDHQDMQDRMFDQKKRSFQRNPYCMYVAQGYKFRETLVGLRD